MTIEIGQKIEAKAIFQIYQEAKIALETKGVFQWTKNYPNLAIITEDLRKQELYILENKNEIIGAISLNEEQETAYQSIEWQFNKQAILVVHRLVIRPRHQGQGHAKRLMDFAEDFAQKKGYAAIRLDAYSQNKTAIRFYERRHYFIRGQVFFPERKHPFYCMEKEIL